MTQKSVSPVVRLRSFASKLLKGKYAEQRRYRKHGRRVLDLKAGHDAIAASLASGEPMAVGKIGDVEMEGVYKHRFTPGGETDGTIWNGENERLYINAGVFPPSPEGFRAFTEPYLDGLSDLTHLAVWYNRGEERVTREQCPEAVLMPLRSLEPYYFENPWSAHLEGKRVLVATPFPKTFAQQYEKREALWTDGRGVLPEFEVSFVPVPPHAHLLSEPVYPDWVTGLNVLKDKVSASEFEVLLVGAGAWSVPLAAHAKRMGKAGIHLGGGLQVLFGVKGRRWEGKDVSAFWNDAWTRPLPEETPGNVQRMESGAYW